MYKKLLLIISISLSLSACSTDYFSRQENGGNASGRSSLLENVCSPSHAMKGHC